MDLSHPESGSVNDAINPSLGSLSYISGEKVAKQAMSLGRGALLEKIDIKSAYRLVPVHPSERMLVGMENYLWTECLCSGFDQHPRFLQL